MGGTGHPRRSVNFLHYVQPVNARAVETGVVVPGVTTSELTTAGLGVAVVQLEVAASRL